MGEKILFPHTLFSCTLHHLEDKEQTLYIKKKKLTTKM